jgi:single-strand DNA-binding protein
MAINNSVLLMGNLVRDIETKTVGSDDKALTLAKGTLAVNGIKKDDVEYIDFTFFGKRAETLARHFGAKGQALAVEGRIHTSKYEDKDGNKRRSTEVIGDDFKPLGGKPAGGANGGATSAPATAESDDFEDSIPL